MIKKRYLFIIFLLLTVCIFTTTYAYFYVTVTGGISGSSGLVTGTLGVNLSDSAINVSTLAPTYDEYYQTSYKKTFTVTNTSDNLDGDLALFITPSVMSNSLQSRYFKYRIESPSYTNEGTFENMSVNDDYMIISDIDLPANGSITFDLYIWLSNANDENQQSMLGGSMTAKITALLGDTPTSTTWYNSCSSSSPFLRCKMLTTNTVASDSTINFGAASSSTNGQGLYYTSDTTKTINSSRIYYYRGNVTNNYAIFAGKCFKIIRTTENGGVKLFYWGELSGNSCSTTASTNGIGTSSYSVYGNNNRYLGYMYGNTCTSYSECNTKTLNSSLKTFIDSWYNDNIITLAPAINNLVENIAYCNDRQVGESKIIDGVTYGELANSTNNVLYSATNRLALTESGTSFNGTEASPSLLCQTSDRYTLKETAGGVLGYGNNALDISVGTISADELVYAGASYNTNNTTFYLKTGSAYHTMTPSSYTSGAYSFYLDANGSLKRNNVTTINSVYPVIAVSSYAQVISGNGTASTPFIITSN